MFVNVSVSMGMLRRIRLEGIWGIEQFKVFRNDVKKKKN